MRIVGLEISRGSGDNAATLVPCFSRIGQNPQQWLWRDHGCSLNRAARAE